MKRIDSQPPPASRQTKRWYKRLWGRLLIGLAALVGIAFIAWNGFQIYMRLPVHNGQHTPIPYTAGMTISKVTANAQWQPVINTFGGVNMLLVPAGCFQMGSTGGHPDEAPVHQVCLEQPFWIDQTEVTETQFKQFNGKAANGTYFPRNRSNRPIRITWFEARDFCALRGARLPTEAEWEYAARGPDGLNYPWSNYFIGDNLVYVSNSNGDTADVGSRPAGASWVGALDMSGNVWEWTSSLYKSYPYNPNDGREDGNNSSDDRVLRGGDFGSGGYFGVVTSASTSARFGYMPSLSYAGFRCVRLLA